jgi:putative ABC transport system substrate-binding protein
LWAGFVERLRTLGWIEGRNIVIQFRWAGGRSERYEEIAAEFIKMKVDVIVTSGTAAVAAAKRATPGIPIVFAAAGDPIATGLVASLAHPGGNVTGLSIQQTDLSTKRLELLREAIPGLRRLAILANVGSAAAALDMREVEMTARSLGLDPVTLEIRQAGDIATALASFKDGAQALYVIADPLIGVEHVRINSLALTARMATMHGNREHAAAGGLMSYGPNLPALFRRAADYVDKILRGAKPGEIPVEQPTKFDFVINLKTAKALGINMPDKLLALADEVIE